jgi:polysaccharide pyruvyl transferase WcaK-like protein
LREFYPDARFAIVGFTFPTSIVHTQQVFLGEGHIDIAEARTSFHQGVQMALRSRLVRRPTRDVALKYFWWADAVIDLSAGDGFGDTYGTKVLLRHSIGKFIALHLGKPLAIFPQTMGPFQTRTSRLLARYLLRRADLVCVREHISEKIVQGLLGPNGKVICLADMAFLMPEADISAAPHLLAEFPDSGQPIGVNVSGFLWHRGQEMYRERNVAFDYREMIVGLVRRFVQKAGRPVLLIPHVFSENPRAGDSGACRAVWERLPELQGSVLLLGRDYSAPEIKAIIAQCEFFVGSRMHACIAALSTGTPVVPVSYSHKYAGILQRFGIQDWLVDPKILSQEQALDLVLSGYEHREEIRKQIIAGLPLIKSEAMRAGQLVKDVTS